MTLGSRAFLGVAATVAVVALLLFGLAGTLRYWQAWAYLGVFTGASILITLYLFLRDPSLLERRMKGGPTAERRGTQKFIMLGASAGFIAIIAVPALDRRLGWSHIPVAAVIIGDLLVVLGFYFVHRVYRENTYTSAVIEVARDQRVISTGPYALVRHPMYAGASLYILGTPLALGSYWGLIGATTTILFIVLRLVDEERFLVMNLAGYSEYRQRVKYRLLPFLW